VGCAHFQGCRAQYACRVNRPKVAFFAAAPGLKLSKGGHYDVIVVKWEMRVLQYITLYYILSDTNAARIYILS
jgi:hypothetical protein